MDRGERAGGLVEGEAPVLPDGRSEGAAKGPLKRRRRPYGGDQFPHGLAAEVGARLAPLLGIIVGVVFLLALLGKG
jgi:hypothetical protein